MATLYVGRRQKRISMILAIVASHPQPNGGDVGIRESGDIALDPHVGFKCTRFPDHFFSYCHRPTRIRTHHERRTTKQQPEPRPVRADKPMPLEPLPTHLTKHRFLQNDTLKNNLCVYSRQARWVRPTHA